MKRGGFDVFQGLIDSRIRNEMLSEALDLLPEATECAVHISDEEEVRGGVPRRRFASGRGGAWQQAFSTAPWLLEFLRGLTSPALVATGQVGTYSYYLQAGDYLDIHRDVVTCDVAVITCLYENSTAGDGGRLWLYPGRCTEPLSQIRATPERGAAKVRLEIGQTIVMYGGIVPHALMPLARGQTRIVSVLCYRAV